MDMTHFPYSFIPELIPGLFPCLAIVNNAAVNIGVLISFRVTILSFFG